MSKNPIDLVREFHVAFNRPVRDTPDVGSAEERVLRVRLMLEEMLEFAKAAGVLVALDGEIIPSIKHLGVAAFGEPDLVQMTHELADIRIVVDGTAVQLGLPVEEALAEEVHPANMRKLGPDGKPIVDEHGKVQKPDGWKPANVERIVLAHGCTECAGSGILCGECGKGSCICSPYASPGAGPVPCGCQSSARWLDDPARYREAFGGSGEQTAECESCPDRADFEFLCCKGAVGATVSDPNGLLEEE